MERKVEALEQSNEEKRVRLEADNAMATRQVKLTWIKTHLMHKLY